MPDAVTTRHVRIENGDEPLQVISGHGSDPKRANARVDVCGQFRAVTRDASEAT
ncbi:MAG: hypothetical protein ACLQVI_09560 [Polyangiaceae bacterium]